NSTPAIRDNDKLNIKNIGFPSGIILIIPPTTNNKSVVLIIRLSRNVTLLFIYFTFLYKNYCYYSAFFILTTNLVFGKYCTIISLLWYLCSKSFFVILSIVTSNSTPSTFKLFK